MFVVYLGVSCQHNPKKIERKENNVFFIPDSLATPEQIDIKNKLIGFFYNKKVTQVCDGKIMLIADSSMFFKNEIDITYMEFFIKQINETNNGYSQIVKDGLIPDSLAKNMFEDAFKQAQKEFGKIIIE